MKQTLLSAAIILGVGFSTCTIQRNSNLQTQKEEKMAISNKQKVVALIKSIETGAHEPVSYINPNKYIQHNLSVADGLAGFGDVLSHLPPNSAKANTIRAFQDGDYVFTHTEYNFFGPKIGFDIFRFENGLIVEHWDNLQTTETKTKNGHTMIDGPVQVTDLKKTEENKNLVREFYDDIFIRSNHSKVDQYVGAYIQHNPIAENGSSAMIAALEKKWFKITKVHLILGEGNFILVQSEGIMMGKESYFYDLFRIEDDKIAEHWDIIEAAVPKEQWKNNNGKF